jgi:SsrA-binding protein
MKVIATNRRAQHDYHVIDSYDAGIVLRGSEAKSLREGTVSLSDAYGKVINGEIFLFNLHISPYRNNTTSALDPKRRRKLLMHGKEIRKLFGIVQQKGKSLIPMRVYFSDKGLAKITLAICERRRLYDKKEKMLKAEIKAKVDRIKKTSR